jgi:hypothetical protein
MDNGPEYLDALVATSCRHRCYRPLCPSSISHRSRAPCQVQGKSPLPFCPLARFAIFSPSHTEHPALHTDAVDTLPASTSDGPAGGGQLVRSNETAVVNSYCRHGRYYLVTPFALGSIKSPWAPGRPGWLSCFSLSANPPTNHHCWCIHMRTIARSSRTAEEYHRTVSVYSLRQDFIT